MLGPRAVLGGAPPLGGGRRSPARRGGARPSAPSRSRPRAAFVCQNCPILLLAFLPDLVLAFESTHSEHARLSRSRRGSIFAAAGVWAADGSSPASAVVLALQQGQLKGKGGCSVCKDCACQCSERVRTSL